MSFSLGPLENPLHLRCVIVVQNCKDLIKLIERGKQGLHVVFSDVSRINRRIRHADHVEDCSLCLSSIQVVVQ
jgi:hypothetical protein